MLHREGTFTVLSGRLNVSDPPFLDERVDDCALYELPARNGTWRVDALAAVWSSEDDVVVGPHGACSSSGLGDGTYTAYGRYDAGELVAVRVVYIPDAMGRMP